MAENVVEILVKSRNDTKAGFDSAKADAEIAGDEAGQGFMAKFGSWLGGGKTSGGGGIGGILSTAFSNPYILAGALSLVGALTTELVGIVNGFTAAAAGAGAFYILGHQTISNLISDYGALQTAQVAVQKAQDKYNLDPTKANLKALQTAQVNQGATQQVAQQDLGSAAPAVDKFAAAMGNLQQQFQPQLFKTMSLAFTDLSNLLPLLMPLANAFAGALDGILKQVGKFTQSKAFHDWFKQFLTLVGPSTTAIGQGLGQVMVAVGKLLTVMSAHDVVHALNIAFDVLAGAIKVLTWVVHQMMVEWDRASAGIAAFARAAGRDLANWAQVVDNMVKNVVNWFTVTLPHAGDTAVNWFKALPGKIVAALASLGDMLLKAGADAIRGFMNGLKSVPIIGTVASIASGIVGTFKHILGIGSPSRVLMEIGKNTAEGFHLGLTQSQGGLGGTITSSGGGAAGGWVEARFTGSQGPVMDALMQQQKLWIRRHGGGGSASVQIALGQ